MNNTDRLHRLVTMEAANENKYGFNEYNVIKGYRNTDHDILWHKGALFGPDTIPNSSLYSGEKTGISVKILSENQKEIEVRITVP